MVLSVGVHAIFGAMKRLEIDTPQLLAGNPVIPSGRRPFTARVLRCPKRNRVTGESAPWPKKYASAGERVFEGGGEIGGNEILSGFAAT